MKMMRFHSLMLLLLVITLSSFQEPVVENYRKEADGVVVQLRSTEAGAARQMKLRVVSDKIIQVLSTPEEALKEPSSLMIAAPLELFTDWQMAEKGKDLTITTKSLVVKLNGNTGELSFADKKGNVVLQETAVGAPAFKPVTLNQKQTYAVEKSFRAADGEAYYGLGQHQTGQMNYRGYQVDLTQYNGVAVVPFLVSSKGYGILWDNNSITTFGDVRPYQPLSGFTLYDKGGKKGGLTATYASQKDSEAAPVVVQESTIDYEFLEDQHKVPNGFTMTGESLVSWEGFLESDKTGEHHFRLQSSGYVKVWIDNKLLLDKWREAWNPGLAVFAHPLEKGKKHSVKIEWQPDGGESYIALSYLSPQPKQDQNKVAFASEAADQINYYFVWGQHMDEVISGYRTLTGAAQVMPKWVMGFWQSRERYKTQEELLSVIREFRSRRIPIDNIVLDWSYWEEDQWGSHDFDATRFPDPEGMIEEIHEKHNAKIMISVWPKFYEGIAHYRQMEAKGLLYKQNILNQQRDWIGKGYVSTFYDAFNPEARELFWEMLNKKLYSKGIDAWWLDATEPDVLSNASIEHRKSLMNPTHLGSGTEYFNAYSLMNAKGIYEGQREVNPNERVFILTRSAFAGLQRYGAATWSGDISSTFEELARQIPAGLNFSLSGLPYWTTDIGGFFVENKYDRPNPEGEALEEWRELNARWHQFGAFTPLFRSHGQYPYREMFNIAPDDHKAYQSMVYYNQLRYRLMPYIYSLTGQVYHKDYTLMRALVMDFGSDKNVLNIGNQYMFGPSILVSPVTEYKATSKKLYLPAGTGWYNLYDGSYQQGGRHITADAPYERMPLYVKEGAILPLGPEIQYTTEKPAETITLYVYGGRDGSFELYEDENTNYNYEQGKFAAIPFSYNEKSKSLTIGERKGSFDGMLKERTFNVVYVAPKKAKSLQFDAKPDQVVRYNGTSKTVKLQ